MQINDNSSDYLCQEEYINKQIFEIMQSLRKIRIDQNIQQVQIAKETGLSKQMISKMEKNGNCTLITLLKYCRCIGVDLTVTLSKK